MAIAVKTKGFKKGEVANPNGRPKGAVNATTIKFAKFKTLASEKYEDAFNILWEAMEAKEGWAHQIFFKELVPKKVHQPTIVVDAKDTTTDGRVESIVKELPSFKELTHDEALNEVRVLKAIEQKEQVTKPTDNVFSKLTDAQGRQLHFWLTTNDKEKV